MRGKDARVLAAAVFGLGLIMSSEAAAQIGESPDAASRLAAFNHLLDAGEVGLIELSQPPGELISDGAVLSEPPTFSKDFEKAGFEKDFNKDGTPAFDKAQPSRR